MCARRMRLSPTRQYNLMKRAVEDTPTGKNYYKPTGTNPKPRHPDYVLSEPKPKEEAQVEQIQEEPTPTPPKPVVKPHTPTKQSKNLHKLDVPAMVSLASARLSSGASHSPSTLVDRIYAALPTPHPKQLLIEQSPAKRKVVGTGRRVGKTTGMTRLGIIKMCEGRRVLVASPSQDQVDAFWENCKKWLAPFIESGELVKNENRRILEMPQSGGRLKAKTASDADMLRGDYADFMVLDECAMLEEAAWNEVGAPMLLDNDGDAVFLSSPKRRNWFYNLYVRAQSDTTGRWEAFHATSFDNPHLSEEALQEIIQDLTEDAYRQEIMGEFLEGDGAVFRAIDRCLTADPFPLQIHHRGHFIVMGVDWGQAHDYTALSCFCATCKTELELDRFNRVEWVLARERLISMVRRWGVQRIEVEENSIGGPNIETLVNNDHLPIVRFNTNVSTKPALIRALALCFEKNEATWLPNQVGRLELEAYEAVTSRVTGHTAYSAPKGGHDDTVMARALAYRAAIEGTPLAGPLAYSYSQLGQVMDYNDGGYDPYTGKDVDGLYAPGSPGYQSFPDAMDTPYNPNRRLNRYGF